MKNNFINIFIKNFSCSLGANIILVFIRAIYVFILPKFITVEDFGYWQLYFLYTAFMPFCHLGLVEGIYLRKGGIRYEELDKREIRSQLITIFFMSVICISILLLFTSNFINDENKRYIFYILCITVLISLPRMLFSGVLQMTGLIKQDSCALLSEILVSFIGVVIIILLHCSNFKLFILSDCIGRIFSLYLSCYFMSDIIKHIKITDIDFVNSFKNIKIGIYLLFSNMVGMLALAIVRLIIEQNWGILVFSEISLSFNMLNIIVISVSAAGVALYPMLKRIDNCDFINLYSIMEHIVVVFLVIVLILYYPFTKFLSIWLDNYINSFKYLGIIAPMCLCEAQQILILNNYLKVLRKEKIIFLINIIYIIGIISLSNIVLILNLDLDFLLCGMLGVSFLKMVISNWFLNNLLKKNLYVTICITFLSIIVFVISNAKMNFNHAMCIYFLYVVIIYLFENRYLKRGIAYLKIIKSK